MRKIAAEKATRKPVEPESPEPVRIRRWRGERRVEHLKIMLTADEKRALIEAAHSRDRDVSTWVREVALRAAGRGRDAS